MQPCGLAAFHPIQLGLMGTFRYFTVIVCTCFCICLCFVCICFGFVSLSLGISGMVGDGRWRNLRTQQINWHTAQRIERVVKWLDITTSAGNYFLQQDFLVPILICRKRPS